MSPSLSLSDQENYTREDVLENVLNERRCMKEIPEESQLSTLLVFLFIFLMILVFLVLSCSSSGLRLREE